MDVKKWTELSSNEMRKEPEARMTWRKIVSRVTPTDPMAYDIQDARSLQNLLTNIARENKIQMRLCRSLYVDRILQSRDELMRLSLNFVCVFGLRTLMTETRMSIAFDISFIHATVLERVAFLGMLLNICGQIAPVWLSCPSLSHSLPSV